MIQSLFVDAEQNLWLSPKAGSGRNYRDRVPLMPTGLQPKFQRVGLEADLNRPVFLCVPRWSRVRKHCPARAGLPTHAARPPPTLALLSPTLWGVCAVFSVPQRDRRNSRHRCPWLRFKSIQCHCKFYGTIFIGEFGQNAVVVQLLNTNC